MARFRVAILLVAIAALGTQVSYPSTVPAADTTTVTFNKDVLPILQKNCQACHRPGEIAPMSFLTYEGVRPWAKAIKTAVVNRQMPPWFADTHVGEFRNAPHITDADIKTLTAWADNGAPEGAASDKPAPRVWTDGWRTPPDVIVYMPEVFPVAAQGPGEIRDFLVANPFKEDTWVTSIEVRPGNASVVHHVIVQRVDQSRVAGLSGGVYSRSNPANDLSKLENLPLSKLEELRTGLGSFTTMEAVYAPGTSPVDFRYTDSAKLIHGGGQLLLEVHYTPNGKATSDQTKVGFTVAKSPAKRRFVFMAPEHLADAHKPIPAGDANWETSGVITFNQDVELAWFMPHMHLRGKDMTYQLVYPNGDVETVLSAKFNFNWQLGYELEKPIKVPKGTRLVVTAHHDNSVNNKFNPDAARDVVWGDLTSEEMMLPWFGVVVDQEAQPGAIASYHPRDLVLDDQLKALDRMISSPFPFLEGDSSR